MKKNTQNVIGLSLLVSTAVLTGCASSNGTSANMVGADLLSQKDSEIAGLNQKITDMEGTISSERRASSLAQTNTSNTSNELLPPNAKPGQCYARVFVPPAYSSETVRVVKQDAAQRLETIPASYEWVEEQIPVKEASERLEVVPATYEWIEEKVLVKPAAQQIQVIPAEYKTVTEQILDKPETTMWKKGAGPITKIDEGTGEIMCLVTVPATYKTINKRVLVSQGATNNVEIPAEYTTVKKRIMKTPPTTTKVIIPAEYKTVKVRKLVTDAQTKTFEIPAEYENVTKRSMVSDGRIEWRSVLCKTNATPDVIQKLQGSLDEAGFNPGPIDGVIGRQTLDAVRDYQKAKGLPTGGLTMRTLESLGM